MTQLEIAKSGTPRNGPTRIALRLIVVMAIAAGASAAQGQDKQITVPALSGDLLAGQKVFGRYCQSCHGVNASGTDKGPTLLHRVYHPGHHNDASIYIAVRRGFAATPLALRQHEAGRWHQRRRNRSSHRLHTGYAEGERIVLKTELNSQLTQLIDVVAMSRFGWR